MKIRVKKTWVAASTLALALTAVGGVAVGAGEDAWYDGGNATVPDHDKSAVALRLYNAGGTEVTSGSTSAPLAAFAAADGTVRTGDAFASLFVHLPRTSTAPGAWPGVQVTGTDRFSGPGTDPAPASLAGKPYVATAGGYSLADVVATLPNNETSESFAGVYELRLRTSSETAGVGEEYAAAYVKVAGTAWQLTTAPILGDEQPPDPTPVATSVAVAWPAALGYGRAATVRVTVTAASGAVRPSGSVRLVLGATTLATATLSATGTASLPLGRAALAPGARSLRVLYAGVAGRFGTSASTVRSITVAKAAGPRPVLRVTKKPTRKKVGKATITVAAPAGLVKAGGRATVVLTKGKAVKRVVVTLKSGKATAKLPKLPKGTWSVRVDYRGDAYYQAAKSKTAKVKSK